MKLRKWVEYLLAIIGILMFMSLGSDCDNLFIFFISKVIALAIIIFNAYVIEKYGTLFKD